MGQRRVQQTFAREGTTTPLVDPAEAMIHMTASGCAPCEAARADAAAQHDAQARAEQADLAAHEAEMAATLPGDADTGQPEADPGTGAAPPSAWEGPIGMEGVLTGDGRLIEPDALRWDDLPIPLRHVSADVGAHDGAVVVGTIDTLERREGGQVYATGRFDLDSEDGREAARHVASGLTTGVSMDLDDVTFEVRVAADVMEAMDAELEALLDPEAEPAPPQGEENPDGTVTVATVKPDDEVRVTTDGRVRAATLVAIPAFSEAKIRARTSDDGAPFPEDMPDQDEEPLDLAVTPGDALTASSVPVAPPAAWFDAPDVSEATPLTVSDTGRLYGHLAAWGTCHTTHTQRGQCISPPHSASGYAHFRLGSVRTAEGTDVATGPITMDTKHATLDLSAAGAASHYDNTGSVVADVAVGEDMYGIWVAGALRPGTTPEQVRALRAAPLSGDWRRAGTSSELVAVLAVNTPGFPIPRPQGRVSGGHATALVASGMLPPRKVRRPGTPGAFSAEDIGYLRRLLEREKKADARADAAQVLARRMERSRAETKVRAFAAARAATKGA